MKKIITLLSALACLMTLISCGSTSAEKRSLRWTAVELTSIKKVMTLAENYEMQFKQFEKENNPDDILIHAWNDSGEHIVYMLEVYNRIRSTYAYVENSAGCSSCFFIEYPDGIVTRLKNDSSAVSFNRVNYVLGNRKAYTEEMLEARMNFRQRSSAYTGVQYKDEIKEIIPY